MAGARARGPVIIRPTSYFPRCRLRWVVRRLTVMLEVSMGAVGTGVVRGPVDSWTVCVPWRDLLPPHSMRRTSVPGPVPGRAVERVHHEVQDDRGRTPRACVAVRSREVCHLLRRRSSRYRTSKFTGYEGPWLCRRLENPSGFVRVQGLVVYRCFDVHQCNLSRTRELFEAARTPGGV